jgi:O-antigen ligase
MTSKPLHIIPMIGLAAVLAMSPVAPEAGNIIFLVVGAVSVILMWPSAIEQLRRPVAWMPLSGLVLIALAYGASAGLDGLTGLLYFAPVLAIWPMTTLLRGTDVQELGPYLAMLAVCGTSGAAIMALQDLQLTGTGRAGGQIANPIHFADVALLVGFLALIGMAFVRSLWRLIFLVAPAMALVAVALSGTRGAIVAFVAMIIFAAASAVAVRLVNQRLALLGLAVLIGASAVFLALGGSQISGIQRVIGDISDTLANGAPADRSTQVRLQMYLGGYRAFLESPIFGQGPLDFTAVADGLVDAPFSGAPHLHNDVVDMAASGGILGLVAYMLLLSAPIVDAWRAPPSSIRPWTIILAVTLVGGFFVMGLTNAMFGILNITTTFAAICVIVGMLASPSAIHAPPERL